MSWLRQDDGEVLDSRITKLSDAEYRAHKALLQYVARDHHPTGTFHITDLTDAIYGTTRGPKHVRRAQLERFLSLGLVICTENYDQLELDALGNHIPIGPEFYRISQWEKYQPPRDTTAAERKRAQRERDRLEQVTRDSHAKSHCDNRDSRAGDVTNERDGRDKSEDQNLLPANASLDVAREIDDSLATLLGEPGRQAFELEQEPWT